MMTSSSKHFWLDDYFCISILKAFRLDDRFCIFNLFCFFNQQWHHCFFKNWLVMMTSSSKHFWLDDYFCIFILKAFRLDDCFCIFIREAFRLDDCFCIFPISPPSTLDPDTVVLDYILWLVAIKSVTTASLVDNKCQCQTMVKLH